MKSKRKAQAAPAGSVDPTWYKEALIYELHIRAFYDSNSDGIGDLRGLAEKLDYLQDLGVTALWLLPFYPSPLRDGGYDIADYKNIHPAYGSLADFRYLLREAHRRGLRIITELVLNHTSSEHAWFQRARRAPPGSSHRNFYVWSDSPKRYSDARIIFKDFESSNWTWDEVAGAYYWHRFYSHQPDLNFDNPAVHREMFKVVDFWLEMGVDGLRLDAVPYLFERDGTNCENLPETHAFLKQLRAHVDAQFPDRMLLAEANQWPVDAASYFGSGDECHMNFHFPLMPRMFMAVQLEDGFPIMDILRQTPSIPQSCQWATFLRNHDELTLEMVTDEDRDYMYQVFAEDPTARINLGIRRRLSPLLRNRRKIELMNALLFALPGTPVIYYGDEIGMGDNIYLGDRDGVRAPMQWSGDRNAGFSRAHTQQLYLPVVTDAEYHYAAINVEAQQRNPSSLLWWMKRLITLRKRHRVFGHGDLEFLRSTNERVLAFVRTLKDERVLVAANLSRFPQHATLDLSAYPGLVPIEMFGRTQFPVTSDGTFCLSFGPHAFYWFLLQPSSSPSQNAHAAARPTLHITGGLRALLVDPGSDFLQAVEHYLTSRRYFRSKARTITKLCIEDALPVPDASGTAHLLLVEVSYIEGLPETYLLGIALAEGEEAAALERRLPHSVIASTAQHKREDSPPGLLYDPLTTPELGDALLQLIQRRGSFSGLRGEITTVALAGFSRASEPPPPRAVAPQLEQSNSIFLFGSQLFMKNYRLLESGANPEVEIGSFLGRQLPEGTAPLVATLEYRVRGRPPTTLAIAQEFVPNQGTAWELAGRALEQCFDRVLTGEQRQELPRPPRAWVARALTPPPERVQEMIGSMLTFARMLGRRTAELHCALASATEPELAPVPFGSMHQQSVYQRARTMLVRTLDLLRSSNHSLSPEVAALAQTIIGNAPGLERLLHRMVESSVDAVLIRHHGDLHLGQVLFTGDNFVIIDFEGEPARPLHERRYKRGALRDVTGMLRSFQYAAAVALRDGGVRKEDLATLIPVARAWSEWVGSAYLNAYLSNATAGALLPRQDAVREMLITFYAIEKCVYEIGYELNNRPHWLEVPLNGLSEILEQSGC